MIGTAHAAPFTLATSPAHAISSAFSQCSQPKPAPVQLPYHLPECRRQPEYRLWKRERGSVGEDNPPWPERYCGPFEVLFGRPTCLFPSLVSPAAASAARPRAGSRLSSHRPSRADLPALFGLDLLRVAVPYGSDGAHKRIKPDVVEEPTRCFARAVTFDAPRFI